MQIWVLCSLKEIDEESKNVESFLVHSDSEFLVASEDEFETVVL